METMDIIVLGNVRLSEISVTLSQFLSTTKLNIENCVEDYSSSRVGVGCRVSPNLNMGLFPNA